MIGSEDERVNQDVGTPRPWEPPTVIADRCLRCGAALDPHRDFDNHGPCPRESHPAEAAVDRLRGIEAAARRVAWLGACGAGGDPTEQALDALREALGDPR